MDAQKQAILEEVQSPTVEALRMFFQNKSAISGMLLFALVLLVSAIAPFFYPVDPFDVVWGPLVPPGEVPELPLGSDFVGRDVLAGIIHGGRATLAVGGAAALITIVIGLGVGAVAGFYGGLAEELLMRLTEFFQVLPALLFAMVIISLFEKNLFTISTAIGVVSWPSVARLTRAEFLKIKGLEYVKAARSIGCGNQRIIWRVILPNALPPLIVSATLTIGVAILFEAALSFLGLGDPNVMSWGLMIGQNRDFIVDGWWTVTFPGVAIFVTVLSLSLLGDGLTDALNPKLRER